MNRQKLSVHTLMCLLACATAACSNDLDRKEIPTQEEGERITATATAGMPQGQPSTRVDFNETNTSLEITWRYPVSGSEDSETFSVLPGSAGTIPSTFTLESVDANDAHNASFTGEITPADENTYYALYPALPTDAPVAATAIPLDMTGQTGNALDEKKVYMYGSSEAGSDRTLNFSFKHLTSIVKVTLNFPNEAETQLSDMGKESLTRTLSEAAMTDVTFTSASGLYTEANADITQTPATYNNQSGNSITLGGSFPLSAAAQPSATVYLHVLPGSLVDFQVRAKVNDTYYIGTVAASATIDAGTMYTKSVEMEADPLADAKVGDFYCKGSDNKGYLIPGSSVLTDAQKKACVGIVCWVGSEALEQDPLLKSKYPNCSHGLVVALENASGGTVWSNDGGSVFNWVSNNITYKDFVDLHKLDKMCGYSNTLALMAYNEEKDVSSILRVLPCDAILEYSDSHPAPTNSSGWYLPSIMELQYVCWGQGDVQSTNGRDNINIQIYKVGGENLSDDNYYWSSTEHFNASNYAWYVYFGNGGAAYNMKYNYNFPVRPLLAF